MYSDSSPPDSGLDRPVFFIASAALLALVGVAAIAPERTAATFQRLQDGIVAYAGWYYVLAVAVIIVGVVLLALSRFGDIKLGPDHAEPDYSFGSWFAMLFAAGMGIGLMFFGVAEPVMHFLTPPVGDGGTSAAAREAMKLTYFHWGLHAWSIYAIVALILAYFSFRHRLPLTLRSALYPLIGERIYGPIGVAVDVFAIVGTTFGVATSLGFGVEQISTGLHHVFGIPDGLATQLILVLATMSLATVSVLLGLDAGIRRLSVLNIGLAVALLTLVAAVGPSVLLAQSLVENTGNYLADLVGKTFNLYAYDPTDWLGGWTIFYWGWWMSWAPFVGLFIARISRGRTIREFVLGAMLGPTAFTLVWMTVFGNTAIDLILNQGLAELGAQVQADESVALFRFFEELPLSSLLSVTALVMVLIFFVTSADSGALVLNMLSSHGSDRTPALRKLFWMGIITSAAVVLLIAGGLSALQTAAIASAFPFSLALLAAMWGFVKALRIDDAKRQALLAANVAPPPGSGEEAAWRLRLHNLLEFPHRAKLVHFLDSTVVPAMRQFAEALAEHGVESSIDTGQLDRGTVRLVVHHDDEADFVYSVVAATQPSPPLADRDAGEYVRAEVHLSEGGQDYCIMGWTLGQVRSDILNQYSSHLQFLHVLR